MTPYSYTGIKYSVYTNLTKYNMNIVKYNEFYSLFLILYRVPIKRSRAIQALGGRIHEDLWTKERFLTIEGGLAKEKNP